MSGKQHISLKSFLEFFSQLLWLWLILQSLFVDAITYIRTHKDVISEEFIIENFSTICLEDCFLMCDRYLETVSVGYSHEKKCLCYSRDPYEMNLTARGGAVLFYDFDCLSRVMMNYTYDKAANLCYKTHRDKMTWLDAKTQCEQEGAVLAKLDTPAKLDIAKAIVREANNPVFIGATDREVDGVWRWIADNSIVSDYTNAREEWNCLEVVTESLIFDQANCERTKKMYICELLI